MRILFCAILLSTAAWAADAFLGSWKINPERSTKTPSGQPRQGGILTVTATTDGYAMKSDSQTAPFILHLDGKDYKDETKGFAAVLGADTSSAQRLGRKDKIRTTYKRNGTIAGTLTRELSGDGKSMTSTFEGTNANGAKLSYTIVFEKQ